MSAVHITAKGDVRSAHFGADYISLRSDLGLKPEMKSNPLKDSRNGSRVSTYGFAFNSDGTRGISGHSDGKVRVWETEEPDNDWANPFQRPSTILEGHDGFVLGVVFSPDGTLAVSADESGRIIVWDMATNTEKGRLVGHTSGVRSIAISTDNKLAVSADEVDDDSTIRVWDLDTNMEKSAFKGNKIKTVCISPSGTFVLSGSWDSMLMCWDLETGKSTPLQGHSSFVDDIAITPDGKLAVSTSGDETIKIWTLENQANSEHKSMKLGESGGRVAISKCGKFAATVNYGTKSTFDPKKTAKIWDLHKGEEVGSESLLGGSSCVIC